tara:strand:- start:400 stop:603 length:204 start_codon:yes stop_codon:yes gene_type:complete
MRCTLFLLLLVGCSAEQFEPVQEEESKPLVVQFMDDVEASFSANPCFKVRRVSPTEVSIDSVLCWKE